MNSVPDPLANILRRHYNVNDMTADWLDAMQGEIDPPGDPARAGLFRRQLAEAILNNTISPAQFKALTLEAFATHEQVRRRLTGLWHDLFGDAPVSEDPPEEEDE